MDAWTFWQLADSSLPTGGFAHSGGLEAALQLGRCAGATGLARFVGEALWNVGSAALPFVSAAQRDPGSFAALDRRCDAALPGAVANRASRLHGQAFLRAATAVRPEVVEPLGREVEQGGLAAHLAPVFGAAFGLLGADEDAVRTLFLFQAARGIVSAAVRLGVVGPLEAQGLLAEARRTAERVAVATDGVPPERAAMTSPLLELWQAHQDRLYSRLFRS